MINVENTLQSTQENSCHHHGDPRLESSIQYIAMANGACRVSGCTCTSFLISNDAQFCDNCGHARSQHVNG